MRAKRNANNNTDCLTLDSGSTLSILISRLFVRNSSPSHSQAWNSNKVSLIGIYEFLDLCHRYNRLLGDQVYDTPLHLGHLQLLESFKSVVFSI